MEKGSSTCNLLCNIEDSRSILTVKLMQEEWYYRVRNTKYCLWRADLLIPVTLGCSDYAGAFYIVLNKVPRSHRSREVEPVGHENSFSSIRWERLDAIFKIVPGCDHCFREDMSSRWHRSLPTQAEIKQGFKWCLRIVDSPAASNGKLSKPRLGM